MSRGRLKLTALAATLVLGAVIPSEVFAQNLTWRACQPDERRVTCVVDGDTLWYQGTKIRLIGIDTPEVEGRCAAEQQIAAQATQYLTTSLNTGLRKIAFDGEDRYGRALARLWVTEGEVGPAMLAAGLAEPFPRRGPPPWCGS
ncbi:thermonuclease family protein [uncultured Tateyamaria sp.]|uniref:thermonuclease family protein n=1 Tax=uncultured Tateyamaria sp. TaxID=455651 RepID=UPI00260C02E2|nr:thermonuclease family protein [uncultured Tateyamaria sp.]